MYYWKRMPKFSQRTISITTSFNRSCSHRNSNKDFLFFSHIRHSFRLNNEWLFSQKNFLIFVTIIRHHHIVPMLSQFIFQWTENWHVNDSLDIISAVFYIFHWFLWINILMKTNWLIFIIFHRSGKLVFDFLLALTLKGISWIQHWILCRIIVTSSRWRKKLKHLLMLFLFMCRRSSEDEEERRIIISFFIQPIPGLKWLGFDCRWSWDITKERWRHLQRKTSHISIQAMTH